MLRFHRHLCWWFAAAALAYAGCGSTVDSLGSDEVAGGAGRAGGAGSAGTAGSGGGGNESGGGGEGGTPTEQPTLLPLTGPSEYPNPLRDDLELSEDLIEERIARVYRQLFHGEDEEVIFYEEGPGEASIRDILHGDIRTEGIGLGMLLAVQRNERADFDAIYTFAKNQLAGTDAAAGYFISKCDVTSTSTADCYDPYGMQTMTMALIFAHGRWQSTGTIDYETEALAALDIMLNKEEKNGGTPDGITDMFDQQSKLPFDVPNVSAVSFSRPSVAMPGYYELWARATGNPFWSEAAAAARTYLDAAADDTTGLTPVRAYFDGVAVPTGGSDIFETQGYRTQLNIVLDQIWTGTESRGVANCNRLISFFARTPKYGTSFELDGTTINAAREPALIAVNGVAALPTDHEDRVAFIQAVWDLPTVVGEPRYYSGILRLFSLMVLGGQMRVY